MRVTVTLAMVLLAGLLRTELAAAQIASCPGDVDGDEMVTVAELVKAVNSALHGCPYDPVIDPANFVSAIDNPLLPWLPGTVFHYKTQSEDITVTVTHDTKLILGVTCTVVHDVVTEDGETTEDTYDWYAQDTAGNVWYFGEDTKAFDDGHVSTEGSWEAGVNGAKPGIVMKADPRVGDKYRQEYSAGVAEDRAEVLSVNEPVEVVAGSYAACVKTEETTRLEPGSIEDKFYCPNIGEVLALTNDGEREELVNVESE